MNKQQFFTQTLAKLIEQGGPAWNAAENTCMYRAGTRKCAIGMWIPDAEYEAEPREAFSACEAVEYGYWPTITELAKTVGVDLMNDLQYAHDTAADTDKSDADWLRDFMGRLEKVTFKHNLKMETVDG